MNSRKVVEQIKARAASDGDGVKLKRVFGGPRPERFDPFLMLDEFGSEEASDYIGGFPPHPHRGFETVTYMLEGKMEHRDHMNNIGLLNDGDIQWMTAGRGIIHSEMPKQTEGRMRGFQLWVNLPAARKMTQAKYQDIAGKNIPQYELPFGTVKAIAGHTAINGQQIEGFFTVEDTDVLYLDIHLLANSEISVSVADGYTNLVYVYEGETELSGEKIASPPQTLTRFSGDGDVLISNHTSNIAKLLVFAGKPLNEPIAQYGPFVMNTPEEVQQAMQDYQAGVLTA